MGIVDGQIHLQQRGVINRRCGRLPDYFGHLFICYYRNRSLYETNDDRHFRLPAEVNICSSSSVSAAFFTLVEVFLTVEAWKHVLQPLDLKLLVLVMESLTAHKEELDNANSRKNWSDRVRTVSPVVQQLLDSVSVQKYADRVNASRYFCFFVLYSICMHSLI